MLSKFMSKFITSSCIGKQAMRFSAAAANEGGIPKIEDFAVGAQKEEIDDFDQGVITYNRDPIVTTEADGNTKCNPILVPSFDEERAVGVCHNDTSYLMWFNLAKGKVHYVPQVEKYFKLYNPSE